MSSFHINIEEETQSNTFFRKVVFTGKYSQIVLMCLAPGEDIGMEVHDGLDQFFRFEKGFGKVIIGDDEFSVTDGDSCVVPEGTKHNILNTSDTEFLKLYTIYTPPHHPENTIHKTKAEALLAEKKEKSINQR